DEKQQVMTAFIITTLDWIVPFLRWNNTACGFENMSYPASELWLPSIQIAEHMDQETNIDIPYLQLNYTGGVHLVQLKRVTASCQMDIFKFPFDVQNCSLTFHSYLHEENELKLISKPAVFIFDLSVHSDSGWRFVNVKELVSTTMFTSKRIFSSVKYSIFLKREASLYVANLLVPSCFLSLLDLFSFFLPPENVDRSAFKMTLILGYTVFLLITNDLLPDSASHAALINVFFSFSLALMVASLLEAMFIVNLSNNSKHYHKVPRWLHIFVLDFLAHLLCMSPKPPVARVTVTLNPHADGISTSNSWSLGSISCFNMVSVSFPSSLCWFSMEECTTMSGLEHSAIDDVGTRVVCPDGHCASSWSLLVQAGGPEFELE
ncbi:hypothetical protein QTP70_030106, partial [Hemibagrus guttatus]